MNTALIIRPADAPFVRVLEVDGPYDIPRVHHYSGRTLPMLTFEQFHERKEARNTTQAPGFIDLDSAARISRLIAAGSSSGFISARQVREIQYRLELLFPGCTDDTLRTLANQSVA